MALDVGSSSVRAIAYDEHGDAEPGDAQLAYAEPDADRLVDACRAVLAQVGEGDALAISCFWHSLLPVDEHDRPLSPVLSWRDLAGTPPHLDAAAYHRRTGCFLHPAYWPAKIQLLREQGVRAARFLSFGDYLLLRLAGEARTSVSMASGTGLYDPNRLDWDDETLEAAGVGRAQLAPVSDEPVAGVLPALGDGACSNAGAGCTTRERAAVMVGTSAAVRVVYDAPAVEPRPGLFLYRLDEQRLCEGGALSDGGNLYAWLARTLRQFDEQSLGAREPAAHGLVFLPFLGGERSLGWDPDRRGVLRGLSFATTPLDIAQAALEGVCYRLAAVLDALGGIESVVATGGALFASPDWVQLLADVLGRPVEVSAVAEASARGAALAALGRLGAPAPVARVVEPRSGHHAIHLAAMEEHRKAMQREECE
ncbi:MAG TPA: gluconokinase [Gaiellaceae bacterium]